MWHELPIAAGRGRAWPALCASQQGRGSMNCGGDNCMLPMKCLGYRSSGRWARPSRHARGRRQSPLQQTPELEWRSPRHHRNRSAFAQPERAGGLEPACWCSGRGATETGAHAAWTAVYGRYAAHPWLTNARRPPHASSKHRYALSAVVAGSSRARPTNLDAAHPWLCPLSQTGRFPLEHLPYLSAHQQRVAIKLPGVP